LALKVIPLNLENNKYLFETDTAKAVVKSRNLKSKKKKEEFYLLSFVEK